MTLADLEIERDAARAELRGQLAVGAANQPAQSRQHLLHPERLRHVVVGSAVDALDLLVPAPAGGQHQHRHGEARFTPAAEQREPVDPRQAQVEHDGVVRLRLPEEVRTLAVRRAVHGVARGAEGTRELLRQERLVLHHQHAQNGSSRVLCRVWTLNRA